MTTNYHHGVRATDQTLAPSRIAVGDAGEIGILGTAPGADSEKWPVDVPVDITGDITKADTLGLTGTLPLAIRTIWNQYGTQSGKLVIVRQDEIADPAQQLSAMVGNPTDKTGIHAFKNSVSLLGIEPDLLIAPGFAIADSNTQAQALITEMVAVGQSMRSFVFADGPNTTTNEAIQNRSPYGSDRLMLIDPMVKVWDTNADAYVDLPGSVAYAGVQSKLDMEKGFWWSCDNKKVNINGLSRPVYWRTNDPSSEATHMNANQVATFYQKDGFYTWGGETTDSERLLGGTIVGRRVADKLYDALERGLTQFVGYPTSLQLIKTIEALGRQFLQELQQKGALIGYEFALPEALNTAGQLADGIMFYHLKYVEAVPVRDVEIWGYRTPGLYEEFLTAAAAQEGLQLAA